MERSAYNHAFFIGLHHYISYGNDKYSLSVTLHPLALNKLSC
jgi:hypothetical protein